MYHNAIRLFDRVFNISASEDSLLILKKRMLGFLILASLPIGITLSLVVNTTGISRVYMYLVLVISSPFFILGIRRNRSVEAIAFVFGLIMQILFLEGLVRIDSHAGLVWLSIVPLLITFAGGIRAGWTLSACAFILILFFILLPSLSENLAIFKVLLSNTMLSSRGPGLDAISLLVFLITSQLTAHFFNNLIQNQHKQNQAITRELQQALSFQQDLFVHLPAAVYLLDTKGKILEASIGFAQLVSSTRLALSSQDISKILKPLDPSTSRDSEVTFSRNTSSQRYVLPDGSERLLVILSLDLKDETGGLRGTLCFVNDATPFKKREAELEQLIQWKQEALSLLGHDLRGPLSAFMDLLGMFNHQQGIAASDLTTIIANMEQRGRALLMLANELLDWAQIDELFAEFSPKKLSLDEILDELWQLYLPSAESKGIILLRQTSKSTQVLADRRMLSSILRNLIGNAIKFTPPGGKVEVIAKLDKDLEVQTQSEQSQTPAAVTIRVNDTGQGMSPSQLTQFYGGSRISPISGTIGELGSGFGLKISKQMLDKHQAPYHIRSEPGLGTSFTFTLQTG